MSEKKPPSEAPHTPEETSPPAPQEETAALAKVASLQDTEEHAPPALLQDTEQAPQRPDLADTAEAPRPETAPPDDATEEMARPQHFTSDASDAAAEDNDATEEMAPLTLSTSEEATQASQTPEVTSEETSEVTSDKRVAELEAVAAPAQEATEAETPAAKPKAKGGGMRAVGIVGAATVLSRILGLVREMVFVALFSRMATDAFSVAFTIPNLLRRLLAEGILSTAFIPVFSGVEEQDEATKRRTYGAVLGIFSVVLVVVTTLGIFLSPWLVKLFAPGFTGQKLALTIFLTRLMFPYLLLVGLASFWIAILHTRKSFAAPALGPVLLNVGMIGCAVTLHAVFSKSYAVSALAIGVLAGGILQLVLQIWALAKDQLRVSPRWEPKHPAIREIGLLMAPTLIGLGVYQINVLISRALASLLPKGSITYIYLSDRVMELPLGVIAVAFATVNLPTLARQAEGQRWDDFRDTLINGVRNVLFFCVPAGIALFVLREPVIMTLFQRGRFTAHDVAMCAHVFMPAAFGLIFVAMLRNLTPGFYAYKDTKTPVKIAAFSLVLNASLSGLFAFLLGMGPQGLTLANACSSLIAVGLAIGLLHKRLQFDQEQLSFLWDYMPRLLVSAGLMAMILWLASRYIPWSSLHVVFKLASIGVLAVLGGGVYFALTWHLDLPESKAFVGRFGRLFKRFKR